VAGLNLGLSLQALLPQDQPEQQETGSQAKTAAGNYFKHFGTRIILKQIDVGGLSQPGCSFNAGCVCMLQVGYDPECGNKLPENDISSPVPLIVSMEPRFEDRLVATSKIVHCPLAGVAQEVVPIILERGSLFILERTMVRLWAWFLVSWFEGVSRFPGLV
jgi:hypothetical protein